MGLFDKKYCDVCGEKIGLLGNRKLEDGNLCKDCAKKLSPFFSERRKSTVEDIKRQLAYREENKRKLESFSPMLVFGNNEKVYVDRNSGKFIVTRSSNWRADNPDLIDISQVLSVNTDIVENKDEIYREDRDGNRISYNPPRYEVEYEFNVVLSVDSPWFTQIELELSDGDRPDSRMTDTYREYERQMYELSAMLSGAQPQYNQHSAGYAQPSSPQQNTCYTQPQYNQQNAVVSQAAPQWQCAACNAMNTGKFCINCGTPQPQAQRSFRCDKCGWTLPAGQQIPRFCPQCGDPVDFKDIQ